MSRERLEKRLKELKAEYENGQKMLVDWKARTKNLKASLLRLSGAIQILEETLAQYDSPARDDVASATTSPSPNKL